ncbi:Fe2og oxygenase family oxidoreductase [Mycena venus]|uniref:Fe2og oxygenase family oxidoreductase n=1 Tax=Mycena venus TaxID=2733690 RepID=A0A8H6U1F7_9AGAR|nr:Fe2og oxygenase family oxidoreductase [Mycena venus]
MASRMREREKKGREFKRSEACLRPPPHSGAPQFLQTPREPESNMREYHAHLVDSDARLRDTSGGPQKGLKIATDVEPSTDEDSPNSLFDDGSPSSASSGSIVTMAPAMLYAPPIPGLYFTPSLLLPQELADEVTHFCLENYFNKPGVNQIMLFGVASSSTTVAPLSGLPPVLVTLLSTMSSLLEPSLPPEIHSLLFPRTPTRARQAILNLYRPGEGIIPHVDLLRRFGDGIVGASFQSSCVMEFARVEEAADAVDPLQLFLPEREHDRALGGRTVRLDARDPEENCRPRR